MDKTPAVSPEVEYEQTIKGLLTLPEGYKNKLPWVGSKGWLSQAVDTALSMVFRKFLRVDVMLDEDVAKLSFIRGFYRHHIYLTGFAVHLLNLGLEREAQMGTLGNHDAVIQGVGLGSVFIPKWCLHQLHANAMPALLEHYAEKNHQSVKQLDVLKNAIFLEHTGTEAEEETRVLH